MKKFSEIIKRVQKSPKTIHIKGYRFLKRKIFSKFPQKEADLKGIILSEKHLFTNIIIDDFRDLEEADSILNLKRYDLLGKVYTIQDLNWHKDFSSGKVWEKKHWTEIEYDTEGDKKVPWELSKCQHFITLGLAYRKTGKKEYFQEYKKQLLSWIEQNPYQIGINWVTPMECAIRAVNWIESYYLFKEEYDESLKATLIKQLYLHGKHIRQNMEWSPAKENHYLSDCMGLFFIGTALENCKEAQQWKIFAKKELEKEILTQVSQEGVDYEASLNYHRLVTEIVLLCYILGERTKNVFSEQYQKRLENMCNFIMYYTSPRGKAPSFGDTDNGRIFHIWDSDINDHRDILAIGSVLFKRGDFKAQGKYQTRMQLLVTKEDYTKQETEEKELTSKAFTDWYIMRDAEMFAMIHCGDIGRNGFGGHGHNDQLSFVMSTQKGDYIIDPGTYSYTSDKKRRHFFRSSVAHNSIVLNKQEQNGIEEERPFDMGHKSKALCFQWQSDKIQDVFIGKNFAYTPNILTREIHYEKRKKELTITERTKEDATMELHLTFDPSVHLRVEGKQVILNEEIEISCEVIPIVEKTPFSREYGAISQTNKIVLKKEGNNLITKISFAKRKEEHPMKEEIKTEMPTLETKKPETRKVSNKQKTGTPNHEEQYY